MPGTGYFFSMGLRLRFIIDHTLLTTGGFKLQTSYTQCSYLAHWWVKPFYDQKSVIHNISQAPHHWRLKTDSHLKEILLPTKIWITNCRVGKLKVGNIFSKVIPPGKRMFKVLYKNIRWKCEMLLITYNNIHNKTRESRPLWYSGIVILTLNTFYTLILCLSL